MVASAVVDKYSGRFQQLDDVRVNVTVGNKALTAGPAVTRSHLTAYGKPFPTLRRGVGTR